MRLPGLALLGALLIAFAAPGEEIRVDLLSVGRGGEIVVSWELPPGFEESELLLEVKGGPRVRLTNELRSERPEARVTLPLLAGVARFVVRAGRENEEEGDGWEERDVAYSESFSLAGLPTSCRFPVRAPASRPVPGLETEWWSDPRELVAEVPASGLSSPRLGGGLPRGRHFHAHLRKRAASPATTPAQKRPLGSTGSVLPERSLLRAPVQTFSGATVPLRT